MKRMTGAVALCLAGTTLGCVPHEDFCQITTDCADGDCQTGSAPTGECISFEEAAVLSQSPHSGIYKVVARAEGSGFTHIVPSPDAVCQSIGTPTCYVRRGARLDVLTGVTNAATFEGWSGCTESTEERFTLGPIVRDETCVAHYRPIFP